AADIEKRRPVSIEQEANGGTKKIDEPRRLLAEAPDVGKDRDDVRRDFPALVRRHVVQGIEADDMREGSRPPVDEGLGGTVSDPLGGIAVLVDVAEAPPRREVGRHQALKPGRLSGAGAAYRVGVLEPVRLGDGDGFAVGDPVSEYVHTRS